MSDWADERAKSALTIILAPERTPTDAEIAALADVLRKVRFEALEDAEYIALNENEPLPNYSNWTEEYIRGFETGACDGGLAIAASIRKAKEAP